MQLMNIYISYAFEKVKKSNIYRNKKLDSFFSNFQQRRTFAISKGNPLIHRRRGIHKKNDGNHVILW